MLNRKKIESHLSHVWLLIGPVSQQDHIIHRNLTAYIHYDGFKA